MAPLLTQHQTYEVAVIVAIAMGCGWLWTWIANRWPADGFSEERARNAASRIRRMTPEQKFVVLADDGQEVCGGEGGE